MTEPQDDDSHQGYDGINCCEICEESVEELYCCQACGGLTFCSRCWKAQAAHIPRKRATLPVTLHEKTMLSTIRVVRPAFSNLADNATIETRLAEDADAAWFGESRNTLSLCSSLLKGGDTRGEKGRGRRHTSILPRPWAIC
jgi:hypothetical protein